jgi:hypothetical protein
MNEDDDDDDEDNSDGGLDDFYKSSGIPKPSSST